MSYVTSVIIVPLVFPDKLDMSTLQYKYTVLYKLALISGFTFIYLIFHEAIQHAIIKWDTPEYSHAYLIPLISLLIIWQSYDRIKTTSFDGAWSGIVILLLGIGLWYVGEASTLFIIIKYAFLVVLFGFVMSMTGIKKIYLFLMPIFLLFFTIPLPNFIYNNISASLQLLSSDIGVQIIRFFGISVFLEGSVIDLGALQLQVVEACNGLRYLFPLITLGVITAYFYRANILQKTLIVLSTIPITILMNSFRIAVIGVLVDRWGVAMAEGFIHDFEGWIVFMMCFAILIAEIWLLNKLFGNLPLREVLRINIPVGQLSFNDQFKWRQIPMTMVISLCVLIVSAVGKTYLPEKQMQVPDRVSFFAFPQELNGWQADIRSLEKKYINSLKFDDYLLRNYSRGSDNVELYIAYYDSQQKGESAHSPRSCLPGDGWQIKQRDLIDIDYSYQGLEKYVKLNAMLIQKGEARYLMYYWFKQRDRHITNEYLVKWYLFWDSLTRSRTDGALVRIIYPLPKRGEFEDNAAREFLNDLLPILNQYIPD